MFLRCSVLVLLLGLGVVAQVPCQISTTTCCSRLPPYLDEYNCHDIIVILKSKEVQIHCKEGLLQQSTKATFWDTINLPPDVRNVINLLVRYCSFPLDIKKILDNLKITTLVKLTVDFTNKFGNATLTSDCFHGLVGLEELDLKYNNFTHIENNSLSELTDLNSINMQLNNLRLLTDSMFQYAEKLEQLDLSENKISNLSENIFQNLTNLKYLFVRKNKLQDINNKTFRNLKNLEVLDLSFNNITILEKNSFSGLKSLKTIILEQNKFTGFPNNIFEENLNLEFVNINNNELLTTLPDYLFANLQNLTEVQLQDCNLTILPENLFGGCKNLQRISLKGNSIKSLPENIFADLENLQVLNLGSNKLRKLSGQLFKNLGVLEEINLNNNLLKKFDRDLFSATNKLKNIILSYNQIEVPTFKHHQSCNILKKLEELDLSHNRIKLFISDWFKFSTELKKLDLSHNQLIGISFEDIFAGSPNVVIDLTYNSISMVNFSTAERIIKNHSNRQANLTYHIVAKLNNNPIDCNCHSYDLIRYFDGSMDSLVKKYVKIQADNLLCEEPSNFINSSVIKLEPRKVKCTFDQLKLKPCSDKCDCNFRPWDRALLINCKNRSLTKVPKITLPSTNIYNQTHVTLEHNYLTSGPIQGIGYENVTELLLSFNNISQLTWIPSNLKILSLDNNNISQIDVDMLTMVNSSQIINISLGGNPYICDCSTVNFYKFLVSPFWNKKIDINHIKCENDGNILVHLTTNDLCPASQVPIYVAYAILAIIIFMICIFLILSHRYKIKIIMYLDKHTPGWFPKLPYDAFICYSHKDENFVLNEIMSVLEGGSNPYKLCVHIRDWTPGKIITDQIITSIDNSRKTLIILSSNFLESIWGLVEFKTAHFQAMKQRSAKVIIVLYGDIDVNADLDDALKAYIRTNTYVKWGDKHFWNKLRRALEEPNAKNEMKLSQKDRNIAITLKDNLELVDSSVKTKSSAKTTPNLITGDSFVQKKMETDSVC